MKKKCIIAVFTLLLTNIALRSLSAQDDYGRYQGFIVWEDAVNPSMASEYEEATKKMIDLYREHHFPGWIGLFSTSEFIYYWVFEVDNYADVDTLYREFARIASEAPDEMEAIDKAFEGTHEYTKSYTCYYDSALSYISENPGGAADGMNFRYWSFNYAIKGKMDELKEVYKEWVALAREKGAKQSWYSYIMDIGDETPCIFWIAPGVDAAEFYGTNSADMDLFGDAADHLWERHSKLLRKVKEQVGWYRQDLSYMPGE